MRFNEFEKQANLEMKLKHFFEGKISSKDLSSYIKENQITEADILEGPGSSIFKNAPKVWDKLKSLFRRGKDPKQGELPLKGGSNTRPSAPAAAPKPSAEPKPTPSTAGKVAGAAALGAAGTAAVMGTGGDRGPDKAQAGQPSSLTTDPGTTGQQSGNMDDSSFGKAFAAARKQHGGPGGKFTWRGKEYQTNIKGEKYVTNPTAVSFGAPKPAASQAANTYAGGDTKGEFNVSSPAPSEKPKLSRDEIIAARDAAVRELEAKKQRLADLKKQQSQQQSQSQTGVDI